MKENKNWRVFSNCKSVRMRSSKFDTERYNQKVIIGKIEYSGTPNIDIILPTNFTVKFITPSWVKDVGEGFMLYWSCTQWGEWERLDNGNCGFVKRPLHNGTRTRGILKYKYDETCSK